MRVLLFVLFFAYLAHSGDSLWNSIIVDNIYSIWRKFPLGAFPSPPNVNDSDVVFYYTNKTFGLQPLLLVDANLTVVNASQPIIYILHDWLESSSALWIGNMLAAFFQRGDFNIIIVDSGKPFNVSYPEAAVNTRAVGDIVARQIFRTNITPNKFHLIGYGMGAHAAGFAGKILNGLRAEKVARISGLDPAGPLFTGTSFQNHLHRSDAIFVDITHSDTGGLGFIGNDGSVDFYVNSGSSLQPGCPIVFIIYREDVTQDSFALAQCSHKRSYMVYTESILSHNFVARECSNPFSYYTGLCIFNRIAVYGYDVPTTTRGTYFFMTNASPPFSKGA